ncbi:hypothetical protein [Ekhidna sp.]
MQIKLVSFLLLSVLSWSLAAQKIKYKEIYPVLAAKQYDVGIPRLIEYMAIEENINEANANLQMGLWLHERFMKLDDNESNQLTQIGDSALFFLEKAKGLIDVKELKKKDDYYQSYLRRDLRSGKFLIKVSDVHLDIENKMDEIQKLMQSK